MSPTAEARRQRHRIWVGVTLIMASLIVVVIGVQSLLGQREQRSLDAEREAREMCFAEWGQTLAGSLDKRVWAANREDRVEERRDAAIDRIILVAIRFRAAPPRATDDDVSRALDRYYQVLTELREVRAEKQVVREANPYPDLDC